MLSKKIILVFVAIMLFMPVTTQAFSFSDLLWWRKPQVVEEKIEVLSEVQKLTAQEKLDAWINAYEKKDLSLLLVDDRYTNISKSEINYIVEKRLADYKNPPIRDVEVNFSENKIILKGYALKPIRGRVHIEVRVEVMEEQLYFRVTKARYRGFFIPGLLVGRFMYKQLEHVSNFFFADKNIKLRDINIDNNNIKFVIE